MTYEEAAKILKAEIPKIEWDTKTACNKTNKEYYLLLLDAIDVAIEALGY